jgi:hypothetical protein
MQCCGYTQATRIGQLLDSLCQYDTGTRYGVVGNNHFAKGYTDAYFGLEIVREP